MNSISQRWRALDTSLERLFARRPAFARGLVRYGWLILLALAALLLAGGAVTAGGRSQQVVYATQDGSIVALEPVSGRETVLYEGNSDHYATTPGRTGGSRSIAFTVLRDDAGELRGSLYSADLVRETRALLQNAAPGEVLAYPDYDTQRKWVLANRFTRYASPNVEIFTASAATSRLLEPNLPDAAPTLGSAWTAENSIYAWRTGSGKSSLTAYNFFERRQASVYETKDRVGPGAYYFDANAFLFAEHPRGAGLEQSRLKLLAGTGELKVSGAEDLGVYDPSSPVTYLKSKIPVLWTDGKKTGVGLVDPDGWNFSKTGVEVEAGSRNPGISNDGRYVATTNSEGTEITVREMNDGSIVRRIRDVQPPDTALRKMRKAGMRVPKEAGWLAPPNYSWRSFEDQ